MLEQLRRVCFISCAIFGACDSDSADPELADAAPDAQTTPITGDAGPATGDAAPVARPEKWVDTSHGDTAEPDYARVFSTSVVHRIDITMSATTRQAMLDDLTTRLGEPGSGSGFPGLGGPGMAGAGMGAPGMAGFQPPAELAQACTGKKLADACEAQGAAGSCNEFSDGTLLCLPDGVFGGDPGGGGAPGGPGGGGAIDLVEGDPIYVPVTVRYDGGEWTQVGMRYKGNSSLVSAWSQGLLKIGFRLHFDHYEDDHPEVANQRFYGFRELTFSSGWSDDSLSRDAIAAEILHSQGLPAARTAFYAIYVDAGDGPSYWGLYTMIEDPSDVLAKVQFADGGGNMYKPDGIGADFSTFSQEGFVKKSNERAADWSDVQRALDALHASRDDAAAWRTNLEAAFDVGVFLRTLAVSRAIGHWDSYGSMAHNYYLYGDPSKGGRLTWISWDHNLTWQGQGGLGGGGGGGGGFGDLSVMMDEVTNRWPLIRFLLDDPVYRAQYQKALEETLAGALEKSKFDARATELHTLIAPYVVGAPSGASEASPYTHLSSPDAFRNALVDPAQGLLQLAEQRRAAVRAALDSDTK